MEVLVGEAVSLKVSLARLRLQKSSRRGSEEEKKN